MFEEVARQILEQKRKSAPVNNDNYVRAKTMKHCRIL